MADNTVSSESGRSGAARFWGTLNRRAGKGYRAVFMLSMCMGLLFSAIAFMERQSAQIEALLKDDFKLFLVVDEKFPLMEMKNLENKLRSLPNVADIVFVNRAQALDELKATDPELVKSVVPVTENPMPEYFSIKLNDAALEDIGSWLDGNVLKGKMPAIAGVSYKPDQVYAILQATFYRRFLQLVFSMGVLILAFMAFMVEISAVSHTGFLPSVRQGWSWILSGAAGSLVAFGLCWLFVYPVKHLSPLWWSFPGLGWQASVLGMGALCGWALSRWKESH